MATVAVVAVAAVAGGVFGSKVMVDPAGHDLEVVGLAVEDHQLVVAVAAFVVGALAAAARFAAGVAALVRGLVGSQAGPVCPADSEDLDPAVVEVVAAGVGRKVADP